MARKASLFDDLYCLSELEEQLGHGAPRDTSGAIMRVDLTTGTSSSEIVPGRRIAWQCGCVASRAGVLRGGRETYTLEECKRHRQRLLPGRAAVCSMLSDLANLDGGSAGSVSWRRCEEAPTETCHALLELAMKILPERIQAVFHERYNKFGSETVASLIQRGCMDEALHLLTRILKGEPGIRGI